MKSARLSVVASFLALGACSDRGAETPSAASSAADVAAIRALLEEIERTFEAGELEAAIEVFADDAVIMGHGAPDVVGKPAIRELYAAMLAQFTVDAVLSSAEIEVAGDLAYERGTYTLTLIDKASGQVAMDVENRYVHVFKRQSGGAWKEWRMMVNSAEAAPAQP